MKPVFRLLLTAACVAVLALPLSGAFARPLEAVTLQLKWTHAFQFAGYYTAKELGYYRDAGLDVTIEPAQPGVDPLTPVLDGRAQYGVGTSSLLLARRAGQPVVVLAVVFQHSPLVLIARQFSPTQSIQDVAGKRVMIEPQSDELVAYLKHSGVPPEAITRIEHSHQPQALIGGTVDAMSAYSTNEPWYLDRAGVAYHVYTPRSAGIDFYGDNLFTTEAELEAHPARAAAFRAASLRGWEYAMAHPDEIAELITRRYSQDNPTAFYLYEAQRMQPLLRTDLIEPGYMNPGRWRHIADTYASLGLLPHDFPLDGFLYQPDTPRDLTRVYIAAALVVVFGLVAAYTHRINRRLDRALTASRASEERHRLLADHASDVIWTMDADGRFTYVSPSVEKLRGYTVAEAMQQSIDETLVPASAALAKEGLDRAFAAIRAGRKFPDFRGELEQPCKDGSTVWTEVSITAMRNAAGGFIGLLGVTRDISERRRVEERIRHMAQHDLLTGLPNRALFSDRLRQALASAQREGTHVALMFLDLDRFKPVNDTWGHAIGDVLLQQVAQRIQQCLRASDTVARIGGDEFVVLLRTVEDERSALAVAEKIRGALGQPFQPSGHPVEVSASIGLALYPQHGQDEVELSKNADDAMFLAKKNRLDRPQVFQAAQAC